MGLRTKADDDHFAFARPAAAEREFAVKKRNIGSSFDPWLLEEGLYEEAVAGAFQRLLARREGALGIRPGQRVRVIQIGDRVELVPVQPISELMGSLPDIDTEIEREPDRL